MAGEGGLAIRGFFDEPTNTVSYLVFDRATRRGAVIDPVLDFDQRSGKASTASVDAILAAVTEAGVTIDWVLETHAHADHLSAAPYVKLKTGGKVAIGEHIKDGAENLPPRLQRHGRLGRRHASSTISSRTASVSGSAGSTPR